MKLSHLLLLGLTACMLAACGATAPPAPAATEPPTSPPVASESPTSGPASTADPESTSTSDEQSVTDILGAVWRWVELRDTTDAGRLVIPPPEGYTIAFHSHGEVTVQADCNQAGGTFTFDGQALSIELGPSTTASCGEGSLDQQYLALLGSVGRASLEDGHLILHLGDEAGQMTFERGSPSEGSPVAGQVGEHAGIDPASISLDTMDLPYTWQARVVPATPYDSSQPSGPAGLPEHIQVTFAAGQGDQPDPASGQAGDPVLYLIPVAAYQELWEASDDPFVTIVAEELQMVLAERPEPFPTAGMPVLPFEELGGTNDLTLQGAYLDLGSIQGVRFVGRFAQGPSPVTNDGLRYVFQGFSSDEQYLIAFFYPVTTAAVPWSDGVSDEEQERAVSDAAAYMEEKAQMLNSVHESEWDPDLTTLDAMLGTLRFERPAQE